MDINAENLKKIELSPILLNSNLGKMNFKEIQPTLEKLRDLFVELQELSYKEQLTESEVNSIDSLINQFVDYLQRLNQFDISQGEAQVAHDNLVNDINNFSNSSKQQTRQFLAFLRTQVNTNESVRKLQRDAISAKKELEDALKVQKTALQSLIKEKTEVESAHGEVATKKLAKYFSSEYEKNNKEVNKWLEKRTKWLWILIGVIVLNLSLYLVTIFDPKLFRFGITIDQVFNIHYGVINFALISVLTYNLVFATRNYGINSNLASMNKHRMNVANTFEDYLATKPEPPDRSVVLKIAVDSMFKHLPLGYIKTNGESDDSGTVIEFINNYLKQPSNTS